MSKKNKQTKLQYNINTEVAKILASGKIDECEYLTNTEILPSNQSRIIEQAKCTYFPLGKHLETKQIQLKIKEKNNQKLKSL